MCVHTQNVLQLKFAEYKKKQYHYLFISARNNRGLKKKTKQRTQIMLPLLGRYI